MEMLAAFLGASLNVALLQDMADNPEYKRWCGFKVGAYVKLKGERQDNGTKVESETMTKLLEVTESKVVIESQDTHTMDGKKIAKPAGKVEYEAKIMKWFGCGYFSLETVSRRKG